MFYLLEFFYQVYIFSMSLPPLTTLSQGGPYIYIKYQLTEQNIVLRCIERYPI